MRIWSSSRSAVRRQVLSATTGRRSSAGFVSIATVVGVVLSILVLIAGSTEKSGILQLLDGHTWLRNSDKGTLSLVDDETAQVGWNLTISSKGDDVAVTEDGKVAVLVNRSTNEYALVDFPARKLRGTQPVDRASDIDVVTDGEHVYVIHPSGLVEMRDGADLARLLGKTRAGRQLTRGVIDSEGRLWVGDESAGVLKAIEHRNGDLVVTKTIKLASPGAQLQVAAVDGVPMVLVVDEAALVTVEGGKAGNRTVLDLRPGDAPSMPREVAGGALPIVVNDAARVLIVSGDRIESVQLDGRAGRKLGEPTVHRDLVYVPDPVAGDVVVITRDGKVLAPIAVPGAPDASGVVEVVQGDDVIYIQTPHGDEAIQVDADGNQRKVVKYSPDIPVVDAVPTPEPSVEPAPAPLTPVPVPPTVPPPTPPTTMVDGEAPVVEVPASPPSPPRPINAFGRVGEVDLSWAPPSNTGGAPVLQYWISWTERRRSGATARGGPEKIPGSETQWTIPNLRNGATYTMTIEAENVAGRSAPASFDPVTPSNDVPDPPSDVTATSNTDGSITVKWTAAEQDGQGNPVPGYVISAPGLSLPSTYTGVQARITLDDGLQLGRSYLFSVRSRLTNGTVSDPVAARQQAKSHRPPDPPAGLTATPTANTVTLSWSSCADETACAGGEKIDRYRLSISPAVEGAPTTVAAGQTSVSIPNLTAKTSYSFALVAENVVGASTATSITQVAASVPIVTGRVEHSGDRELRWEVSADPNGAEPVTCRVEISGVGQRDGCTGRLTGLAYSQTYSVTATATNPMGTSAPVSIGSAPMNGAPSITIAWGGSAQGEITDTGAPCSANCRWVDTTLRDFYPRNSDITVRCWTNQGSTPYWRTRTIRVDGDGNGTGRPCFFGYNNYQVRVEVGDVRSNTLTR